MTEVKTDRIQYFFMIPNMVFGKAIGITAGIMVRAIGGDVWTSMIIGFGFGMVLILLMAYLCSLFPGKTIVQIAEVLLGKFLGRCLGLVLAAFFIMAFGASANTLILHIVEYFLPETPYWIICILYSLLCMYGVYLGVEVVLRFSVVGFFMAQTITILMMTGTLTDLKPINLLPVLDQGLWANLYGTIYIFGDIALAILAVGIIFPMVNSQKKIFPITFWAMVLGACTVVIWPIYELMVLGPELMQQYVVVCMQQIRSAHLTKYFPRYELIMVSVFTFSVFVQSTVMFYGAKYSLKQVTGLKKDWIFLMPLFVILTLVTYFMGKDHNQYVQLLAFPFSQISTVLGVGLPILLFIVALARGKLGTKKK